MSTGAAALVTYRELLLAHEPHPIRNEGEADESRDIIDELTDLPERTPDQQQFLDLLAELLWVWESEHEEPVKASSQEVVRMFLESNNLRQSALVGPVFPNRHAVSDFLVGRRPLTLQRVRKLAAFFHVSPAAFAEWGSVGSRLNRGKRGTEQG